MASEGFKGNRREPQSSWPHEAYGRPWPLQPPHRNAMKSQIRLDQPGVAERLDQCRGVNRLRADRPYWRFSGRGALFLIKYTLTLGRTRRRAGRSSRLDRTDHRTGQIV